LTDTSAIQEDRRKEKGGGVTVNYRLHAKNTGEKKGEKMERRELTRRGKEEKVFIKGSENLQVPDPKKTFDSQEKTKRRRRRESRGATSLTHRKGRGIGERKKNRV